MDLLKETVQLPSATSCRRTGRGRPARRTGCTGSKGAFNLLAEGPYDEDINTILREVDADKRARLTQEMGQKLYDQYYGVMLGMKSITWAVSKKVSGWQTLVYVPLENNYEYIS